MEKQICSLRILSELSKYSSLCIFEFFVACTFQQKSKFFKHFMFIFTKNFTGRCTWCVCIYTSTKTPKIFILSLHTQTHMRTHTHTLDIRNSSVASSKVLLLNFFYLKTFRKLGYLYKFPFQKLITVVN